MQALLILLCFAAAAQERDPAKGVNFYSLEKEIALGRQIAADFRRDNRTLEIPAAQAYIEDMGKRLAAQIGGPAFAYSFELIDDKPPFNEAVAFPGGAIFVPTSLILGAHDEDEFAGMLAHSIAHIASRDGTKLATKGELVNMASQPLIFMGGWSGYAMRQGAALAVPIAFQQMLHKLDLAADRRAATKMAAAGYDPAALSRYLARVSPPGVAPVAERIQTVDDAIAQLGQQAYTPHSGFEKVREEVRRAVATIEPARKPPTLAK